MKASELRIGNLFIGYNNQVFAWAIKDFALLDLDIEVDEIIKEAIPLTPEWLEKAGWTLSPTPHYSRCYEKFDGDLAEDFTFRVFWYRDEINIEPYGRDKGHQGIEYVHQLQNLYHALTGEELQFKD